MEVRTVRVLPAKRHLLIRREVSAVFLVIVDVLAHESFEEPHIEHNRVVKNLSSAVAREAFCRAVLSGTSNRGAN